MTVALGGALGASSRYAVGIALANQPFPWATPAVNLAGCFLMGLLMPLFGEHDVLKPLLLVGFLGGFTTFSAFGLEGLELLKQGSFPQTLTYFGLQIFGGLALVALGYKLSGSLRSIL